MHTARTKKEFAEALIALAEKKEIEKITVQDLLDACDASRQTFYNHFRDKYDLINWIYSDAANEALKLYRSEEPLLIGVQRIYSMFTHIGPFLSRRSAWMDKTVFFRAFLIIPGIIISSRSCSSTAGNT